MGAPGAPYDEIIRPLYDAARGALPAGAEWFDAHTHIGHNDPDGFEADPEEILAGLDHGSMARAMLFPMHEPDGYRAANDWVVGVCAESGGRLTALARVAPGHEDAVAEAARALDAGAAGLKLHPRSDSFGLPHPVVDELAALVAERGGGPMLFHAGRGIPNLGEEVVQLCRKFPTVKVILAHAGISELGWIAPASAELDNLYFDTAWWQVADMLALFATVRPGQILYASDLPYGSALFHGLAFLRCAGAVGHAGDTLAAIAGGSLERLLAGEGSLDLGPAPGVAVLGDRDLGMERAVTYCGIACMLGFRGADPAEALSLARLALQRLDGHPVAAAADQLVEHSQGQLSQPSDHPGVALYGAMAAQILCGTPNLPLA
ncbi:MAG TPA: amidohydrolase family protein [Solirubrobacteraceae bacterium]|nr:amidohydrolase family protein [Solirubrobacteraceae bacterium]